MDSGMAFKSIKIRIQVRVTERINSARLHRIMFFYKAHPPAHIGIRVGGCNAVDGP
jgi:hypothetical protein